MDSKSTLKFLTLTALCTVCTPNPAPQYYPPPYPGQPSYTGHHQQEPVYSGSHPWPQTLRNFTNPNSNFLDPLSSPAADHILKNEVPRQLYGAPPPPNSGYPQIYKLDNLIIIANPPPAQPQPCIPQRLPPPINLPGGDDTNNRFGEEEPTKCTWAIVACCSPGSNNIRYNCFEVLGCPGFFFDNSPCDPSTVMAAATAALNFYRRSNNTSSTSDGTNNNL